MHRQWTHFIATVAFFVWLQTGDAEATITNYSGNESAFNTAIVGLPVTSIDFDDLSQGEVIDDQYAPALLVSAPPPLVAWASVDAHGEPAIGDFCAEVTYGGSGSPYSQWTFTFPTPVRGLSLWIASINPDGGHTDISVFDSQGGLLAEFTEFRQDDWSYIALLSDAYDIARVDFSAGAGEPADGQGFDSVTIVGQAVGACCFPDGACELRVDEQACLNDGGAYQGNGTICGSASCPGACCLGDASCQDGLARDDCWAMNGSYMGYATQCATTECTGACCLRDGTCEDAWPRDNCWNNGNQFAGEGVLCADVNCLDAACCLPDGSCVDGLTINDCESQGADYRGLYTSCATETCTGACCFLDGTCAASLTINECAAQSGQFMGPGSLCEWFDCSQESGACCLPDGSCVGPVFRADCWSQGGFYAGNSTDCQTVACGACCFADGACEPRSSQATCEIDDGTYQGVASLCDSASCPGACCQIDGSCQDGLGRENCWNIGGSYMGFETQCSTSDCSGVCCLIDGTCVDSVIGTACDGWWAGPNTDCASTDCLGGCCLSNGDCLDDVSIQDCEGQGGEARPNALCVDLMCTGACCGVDGSCSELSHDDCNAQGGVWHFAGALCEFADCAGESGACCFSDGSCASPVFPGDCTAQGGTYLGAGTDCTGQTCTGACCMPDASCVADVTEDACSGMGGWWPDEGIGSECATVTCTGACCCVPPDLGCVESTSLNDCQALGGNWPGPPGSTCSVNCVPDACPGACCLPGGTCELLDPWACEDGSGTYLGSGTECAGGACTGVGCHSGLIGHIDDPSAPAADPHVDILACEIVQQGGVLTFAIETRGAIPTSLPLPDDYITFLWLIDADRDFYTGQPHGFVGSEFNVRAVIGDTFGGSWVDITGDMPGGGTGNVVVNGNRIEMTIDPSQINAPSQFRWRCDAFQWMNGGWGTSNEGETLVGSSRMCTQQAVPAVSEWGFVVMSLLILTVGSLALRGVSRRAASETPL